MIYKFKEFMKTRTYRIGITALLLLMVPYLARQFYFYKGFVGQYSNKAVQIPDYEELKMEWPEFVPLPTSNTPMKQSNAEVLFDISHGNLYQLSEIETLTSLISHRGGHINIIDYYGNLETELQKADAFVVIAPTMPFSEWEHQIITRFVERGGRLLVIADPTRSMADGFMMLEDFGSNLGNIEISNLILEPYGITYSSDYLYNMVENEGNFRNVIFTDINKNSICGELDKVVFYGLHSIKAAPEALITGDENTLSSLTDSGGKLIAAATDTEGRVLALTDLNFMIPPYHQVADNAILIDNIAEFLSGTVRERTLADFPYIFTRPVTLLVDGEKALNTEMLATITGAQHSLQELGLDLTIASEPALDQDLVAFGLFPPDETMSPLLKPFELTFSGFEDSEETTEDEDVQIPKPRRQKKPVKNLRSSFLKPSKNCSP